jgi:hypothetical protein
MESHGNDGIDLGETVFVVHAHPRRIRRRNALAGVGHESEDLLRMTPEALAAATKQVGMAVAVDYSRP